MDLLIVLFSGFLFLFFPGIIIIKAFPNQSLLIKIICVLFSSVGFWICISWYLSLLCLPLSYSSIVLQCTFALYFLIVKSNQFINHIKSVILSIKSVHFKSIKCEYIILIVFILFFFIPFFYISIPPGCDTTMHGYITRLIINNNSLPHSYRPILPIDYFGSYSAGYHIITAYIAFFKLSLLKTTINFVSITVYPLCLLSIVFLFNQFFSEKTAIYASIVCFAVNNSLSSTIGWGGNPTILSFAFCMFSAGLIMLLFKTQSRKFIMPLAFTISAILLTHAIPAITFAYLMVPASIWLFFHFRNNMRWNITTSIITLFSILLLLLPFFMHFKSDNSPELILKIKDWQKLMMNKKLTGNVFRDFIEVLLQIKYRVGDPLIIIAGISLAVSIYFKKLKELAFVGIFLLYTYILIFNCGYWFLPASELLYPERVAFFMIVILSLILGIFLDSEILKNSHFTIKTKKIKFYSILIVALLFVSYVRVNEGFWGSLRSNKIKCDKPTMEAFDWIGKNTDSRALCIASYQDAGMWIPTFSNRATFGTHMHFIHEIMHVNDTLMASNCDKYLFITKRDRVDKTWVFSLIKNKSPLFSNSEIEIYKK